MKLQDLPDELLFQICNQLSINDLISFVQVPEFGSRTQSFYKFYYDEASTKRLAEHLQQNCSFAIYWLGGFPIIDNSKAWMNHFLR